MTTEQERDTMESALDPEELADLAASLHAAPTLGQTAEEAVNFARQQLGADHGGVTLFVKDRLRTVAPTDDVVEKADQLQVELAEGPCRDSAWQGRTLLSPDVAADPRWPRWGPRAAALGIASAIGVELSDSQARRIGAVNLFWRDKQDFDSQDLAFADLFSRHVAIALVASQEVEHLNVAMDGRKRIGQAQGILMERYGLDEERAFEVLRRYSQDRNIKVRDLAEVLVRTRRLPHER